MPPEIFKASLDQKTAARSVIVMAIFFCIMLLFSLPAFARGEAFHARIVALIPIGLWLFVIFLTQAYLPTQIIVTSEQIILKCLFRKKKIERQEIVKVRRITDPDLKNIMRMGACEGVFGSLGLYRTEAHRKLWIYVKRDQKDWIMIQTVSHKYVIAPNEGNRFVGLFKDTGVTPETSTGQPQA